MTLPQSLPADANSVTDSPAAERQQIDEPHLRLVAPDWPPFADAPYEGPQDAADLLHGEPLAPPQHPQHPQQAPTAWTTVAELMAKTFPPVAWIVLGYLVAGLTLLAGRPKLGKSWLVLDWCVAVARGGYTMSNQRACEAGDVLYLALEDNERRLQARLRKVLGSGGQRPDRLAVVTSLPTQDPEGLATVEAWLRQAESPRLIVVDTLAKVRSAKGRGDDPYASDYAAVAPWKSLADTHGVAVVLVHHVRKMRAEDPLEMVSGTNGLTGAADTILVLDRDGQGCTLTGRGRDMEEFERAVQLDKETCRWSVLGEAAEVRRSDERNEVLRHLEVAGAEGLTPAELADAAGMNHSTARGILNRMAKAGEAGRHPERKGSYIASRPA
jgi:hypothetical protein